MSTHVSFRISHKKGSITSPIRQKPDAHAAVRSSSCRSKKTRQSPAGKEQRGQVSNGVKAGVKRLEGDTEEDSGCLSVLVSSSHHEGITVVDASGCGACSFAPL